MHSASLSVAARTAAPAPQPAGPAQVVAAAVGFMRENLENDDLSLARLAVMSKVDHFQMIRLFKAQTGATPAKFLFALRIDRAKRLLRETDRSVTDICFDVGYNGLGTFVSRFTRAVGVSPGRYRSFRAADTSCMLGLIDRLISASGARVSGESSGQVGVPPAFSGLCLVGRFASCVPEARPLHCAIACGEGRFALAPDGGPRKGRYFAIGLPWTNMEEALLSGAGYWRGAADEEDDDSKVSIRLRPPGPLDPPVVAYLPAFLVEAGNQKAHSVSPGSQDGERQNG